MCENRERLETKGTNPLDTANRMFQSNRSEPAAPRVPTGSSPPFFSTWKSCLIEPLRCSMTLLAPNHFSVFKHIHLGMVQSDLLYPAGPLAPTGPPGIPVSSRPEGSLDPRGPPGYLGPPDSCVHPGFPVPLALPCPTVLCSLSLHVLCTLHFVLVLLLPWCSWSWPST